MRPQALWLVAALAVASGSASVRAAEIALGGNVESLLAFARERHPELAAMRHEAQAADERVGPAGALPDPMFGIELRNFTNEGGVNAGGSPNLLPPRIGETRYTVTQALPWFGKRDLRRDLAQAEGAAAAGRAAATWAELAWQIKQTYALHHLQTASLKFGQENLDLLAQLGQITQVRYANGLAAQQDVIRAQTERIALQSELALLAGEAEQTAVRMRALLGQPPNVRLLPAERLRTLPAAAELNLPALEARLHERNPRLATETARIDAAEKARALTYRERYPDVNVGIAAMQERNRLTSYDLMFEINIPLQQESRRAREREAERMLDAAQARKLAAQQQVGAELAASLAALTSARQVEALVSNSLLPQAELTLQAALAGYETGKVDFAAVLDAQRQIRKAKEDWARARVLQQQRLADIERAIGEDL